MPQVRIVVLALLVLAMIGPAAARASTVATPSVKPTSTSAGSQHVRYRAQFRAVTALPGSGAGTITLSGPSGTGFRSGTGRYRITNLNTGDSALATTATVSTGGRTITLGNPVAVAQGDRVQVLAQDVTNTSTVGADVLQISTSTDTTPASPPLTIAVVKPPAGVSVALSSRAAGATNVRYTVLFRPSSTGGLAEDTDQIELTMSAGSLPSSAARYEVTDLVTGDFATATVLSSPSAATRRITTPIDIPSGHRAQVVITGVTNGTAGARQLTVSTTTDRSTVNAPFTLVAAAQVSSLQARRSVEASDHIGRYRIQFLPTGNGGLARRSKIFLLAQGALLPSSIDAYTVTNIATGRQIPVADVLTTNESQRVVIDLGDDVLAGDVIQIDINPVQTADVPNAIQLSTSADTVARTASFANLPSPSIGGSTLRLTPPAVGATDVRYEVSYTAASAYADGTTLTLTGPSGTSFPADGCLYTIINVRTGGLAKCQTVTPGAGQVDISMPAAQAADRVVVRILGVTNGDSTGAKSLGISLASTSAPFSLTAPSTLASRELRSTPTATGAGRTRYDIAFTIPATSELVGGLSTLTVVGRPGTEFPTDGCAYRVDNTTRHEGNNCAQLGFIDNDPGTPTVTFALPGNATATQRRGGWAKAGVPTLEHFMKLGSWFAGTPDDLIEHLKKLEARFPGMQHINLSTSLCTPQAVMLEQFQWVAEAVMPAFKAGRALAAQ